MILFTSYPTKWWRVNILSLLASVMEYGPVNLSIVGLTCIEKPIDLGVGAMHNYEASDGMCYLILNEPCDLVRFWRFEVVGKGGWRQDLIEVEDMSSEHVLALLVKHGYLPAVAWDRAQKIDGLLTSLELGT